MGTVSAQDEMKIPQMDGVEGYTTVSAYLMLLNCPLQNGENILKVVYIPP